MKRLLYIACAAMLTASCSQKSKFTIEGTVAGAADSTFYLYNRSMAGVVIVDSVKADADGHFTISGESPSGPELYVLAAGGSGREYINLSIDSTETVNVKGSLPALAQNYSVEGSPDCEQIRQLAQRHSRLQQRVFDLEQNTLLIGPAMTDSLQRMLRAYKDTVMYDYILKAPQSASAYFALSQTLSHVYWPTASIFELGDSIDDIAYRAVATCWKEYYPQSDRAQQLYNMVESDINTTRKVAAQQQKMIDEELITVSDIIDLSLPDRRGNRRTLSELRGKVVLLDFHLFAADDSGPRILKLRELYNKYHEQGLEIYQVSVDQDEHLWKQAVSALPWITVHDPSASSCARYNVQAVPEYFLIDRNNALYKRSLQMDDVNAEIEKLL